MKKILFIITILYLGLLTSSHSQDFNCVYSFGGKQYPIKLIQKDNYTYIFKQNFESEEGVLARNDEVLIIGNPLYVEGKKTAFRVIIVDKVKKLFNITTLIEPSMKDKYPNNIWGHASGTCD